MVIMDDLNLAGFDFLRILWCDNANLIRAKALRINREAQDLIVGISAAQQAVPVMYDGVVEGAGLDPVGEVYLIADRDTITPLPYSAGHARAMADMIKDGKPWECSPRGFLKKMINRATGKDVEIKAAFENEFYLLDLENHPADETFFASTQGMDQNMELVEEMVWALEEQGMMVEQYYPEAGPGQQEITLKYTNSLQAADNQIAFRETIRAVAFQNDFQVSFLPKMFRGKSSNGCHLHLSLWRGDDNITPGDDGGLSEVASHFVAGIIQHLPALMALTTPTTNSYWRIVPQNWAGAYQCWGYDNREAAIRVVTDLDGINRQFEFKTVDATSNPYLALGCVVAAGIDGLENKIELAPPVQEDPALLSDSIRLPKSLDKSLYYLEEDIVLLDALGPELSRAYLAVKRAELDATKKMTLDDEVNLLKDKY
jgi:glutamine synthetase